MKTTKRVRKHSTVHRLHRLARERADEEARRIPWERLLEARNLYIDWHELYLWARSILEVEDRLPDPLIKTLNQHCPGFLKAQEQLARERPLHLRLADWIDDNIFDFAKAEDWFYAITFYAVRERRYQRAEVYSLHSIRQWQKARPLRYPSFEEWRVGAVQSEEAVHGGLLKAPRGPFSNRVSEARLTEAVARYIDWEAFALWVRPALNSSQSLPKVVECALEQYCPGFIESHRGVEKTRLRKKLDAWALLMQWITDHNFREATAEGWHDAILCAAEIHPRLIRTQEYCDRCEENWSRGLPTRYPRFKDWRRRADAFVASAESSD